MYIYAQTHIWVGDPKPKSILSPKPKTIHSSEAKPIAICPPNPKPKTIYSPIEGRVNPKGRQIILCLGGKHEWCFDLVNFIWFYASVYIFFGFVLRRINCFGFVLRQVNWFCFLFVLTNWTWVYKWFRLICLWLDKLCQLTICSLGPNIYYHQNPKPKTL